MQRFKDILCVVGDVEADSHVVERAVTLAGNNQASLTVVDVVEHVTAGIGMPEGGPISADLQAALVSAHEEALETLVNPYRARIAIQTRVLTGMPFIEIIREVLRNGRDLVIKTPEHRDWLDRLFGSEDMHLLRKCPCPVWLIKPGKRKSYRHILAAIDAGDAYPHQELASRRALRRQIIEMASSLALSEFAELHVAHVWETLSESTMRDALRIREEKINSYLEEERLNRVACLDALMQEVTGDLGRDALDYLKPQTHLVKGSAHKEIPALAKQIGADLIVMGTVARTGVPGFIMGNTAETILNQIDCSVLAVKPPGFTSPVTLAD